MKFRGEVFRSGKTTTGIYVPPEVMTELASGKRPAVKITINDFTYRNTVGVWEGRPVLSISAEVRAKAGIGAGDEVDVTLELDTEPREVTVPPDRAAGPCRLPGRRSHRPPAVRGAFIQQEAGNRAPDRGRQD